MVYLRAVEAPMGSLLRSQNTVHASADWSLTEVSDQADDAVCIVRWRGHGEEEKRICGLWKSRKRIDLTRWLAEATILDQHGCDVVANGHYFSAYQKF